MDGNVELTSVATVAAAVTTGVFPTILMEGALYVVVSTAAAWIAIGAGTPTVAKAAATALYIPPNYPIVFKAPAGATNKVAIIADGTAGNASLALVNG